MLKRYARRTRARSATRWYLVGATAARTGDEMSGPALLLLALAVTGSAASASSLLAGLTIAAAVGGPVFGVLLDRSARPGRLLAAALALYGCAVLAILATLGRVPVAVSVLIAVGAGLLGPALSGGWTSQLPRIVRTPDLPRANAADALTFQLAGLAGPALAGAVAGPAGAPAGVAVSVALIAAALPVAWRLPGARRAGGGSASVLADLSAGCRVLVRSRPLARATAASALSCAGEGVFVAAAPLLGALVLGGAQHGTLLLSGSAVAALGVNAVLARRPAPMRPDTLLGLSALVLAVAMLLAATARPAPLMAGALLAGAATGPQLTAVFAVRHREAPEQLRGQVFTTGASLKISGFALGAALAGPLAGRSVPAALLAAAGFQVLAALSCWAPGGPTRNAGRGDAGLSKACRRDAGRRDAGLRGAGRRDAGLRDAG